MAKKQYTQEFVSAKKVENGTIITDDNRYIRLLRIKPSNLLMRSKEEQSDRLMRFGGLIKTVPSKFSIKSITKPTPIEAYKQNFKKALEKEESEKCRYYINKHIDYTNQLAFSQSVEHELFFIFEYSPEMDDGRARNEEEKIRVLKEQERPIIASFEAIGNQVEEWEDPDIDVADELYKFYNRKLYLQESFQDRIARVSNDQQLVFDKFTNINAIDVDFKDIISPKSINTKESNQYMLVDGLYCSYFYISQDGYPSEINTAGWLLSLMNFGYGIDVDLFFEKRDSMEVLDEIDKKWRQGRITERSREAYSKDIDEIRDKNDAFNFMRNAITRGNEDVYKMTILVSVYSYSKEELFRMTAALSRFAKRESIDLESCTNFEEEGFLSSAFNNVPTKKISELASKDIYTSVISAAYPYSSFTLVDNGGIMIGQNIDNESLVIFNPFDHKKYENSNLTIFGSPGSGKTFTIFSMITRLRYLGLQVFCLSPEKQHEFERICNALDGEFVDVSPAATTRINPFDIWPVTSEADEILNDRNESYRLSWLRDKVDSLGKWIDMMVPGISYEDRAKVKECLTRMYRKKGISEKNDSLFKNKELKEIKEMPIYSDFVRELKQEQNISARIIAIFEQFTRKDGAYKNLNGQTNVNLKNKFIVFGCEHLSSELRGPMMYIILQYIWAVTKSDITVNKAIVIDEGSLLVDGKDKNVGEFVANLFRLVRGYGGSAIFATQSISDLFKADGEFGNTILACASSHLLLKMQPTDIAYVSQTLQLTQAEQETIKSFDKRGKGLLCAGAARVPVRIKASEEEFRLFTTETESLKKIVYEKKSQMAK